MITLTNEMINEYEKKVYLIAYKYMNLNNKEDLLQAGRMGLAKAAENFDESLGKSFSAFSELYIKGEILEFIRRDKNLRVSRDFIRLKKRVDAARYRMIETKGIDPTVEQLSFILGEDKEKIILVLNTDQNVRSFDEPIGDDLILEDTIQSDEKIDQIDLICLNDALNSLDEESKSLIKDRYYVGKTQTEVAKEKNISQAKVYRMERKILDELEYKLAS